MGLPGQALAEQATGAREPSPGEILFEFVGKLTQDGAQFAGFGYLTRLIGVGPGGLFSDPAQASEATAHFTFASRATLTGRSHLHNLEVLDADGELVIHHRATPGASFDDPASFSTGRRVAAYAVHYESVVTAQTADEGSEQLRARLSQQEVVPFWAEGRRHRLGAVGDRLAVDANGWSQRTSAIGPQSQAWVAGIASFLGGS